MLRRTFLKLTMVGATGAAMLPRWAWAKQPVAPVYLDKAFDDGGSFETEHYSGILRVRQIAELVVTSGQIVVCDGLVWHNATPLARQISPGRYPIILTIAEMSHGDQRVAFARLQIRPDRPQRWEMAAPAGKDLSILKEGEIFGYPVDSGTGCFMDVDARRAFEAMSESELDDATEAFIAAGQENSVPSWDWVNTILVPSTGANQVAFACGFGDGFYPSYWGFDAYDQVVCLVTDFRLIPKTVN